MIKGCIFDLDGTLADTVESIAHAVNQAIVLEGFKARPVEKFNFFAGDGMNKAVERALLDAGDAQLEHLDAGIRKAREIFGKDPLYHVKPYDGMVETLAQLRQRGIRIAVLSNKPHLQAIEVVQNIFGKYCFDQIQGQEEGVPQKPDPTGAFRIAERWGLLPKECLYVGDTNTDMKTADAAGMPKVGVTWGFRPRRELIENGADFLADRPQDLLKIQEEIND